MMHSRVPGLHSRDLRNLPGLSGVDVDYDTLSPMANEPKAQIENFHSHVHFYKYGNSSTSRAELKHATHLSRPKSPATSRDLCGNMQHREQLQCPGAGRTSLSSSSIPISIPAPSISPQKRTGSSKL